MGAKTIHFLTPEELKYLYKILYLIFSNMFMDYRPSLSDLLRNYRRLINEENKGFLVKRIPAQKRTINAPEIVDHTKAKQNTLSICLVEFDLKPWIRQEYWYLC